MKKTDLSISVVFKVKEGIRCDTKERTSKLINPESFSQHGAVLFNTHPSQLLQREKALIKNMIEKGWTASFL